jgi:ABC-type transport system substrate-binding protein
VWWHCDNAPPAACDNPVNFGGFNDAQINKDLELGRTTLDAKKRITYYEDLNRVFAKQLYNLWGQWVLWTVAFKPTVHGVLGPPLPDGSGPFPGLPTGHPVDGLWCTNGKC